MSLKGFLIASLVFSVFGLSSNAQVKSFTLNGDLPFSLFSRDDKGFVYYSDSKGAVYKVDPKNGETLFVFNPTQRMKPSSIDVFNGFQLLLFYREPQAYQIVNRFLADAPFLYLPKEEFGFVRLMAWGLDAQLWLLDEGDFSLKKWDYQNQLITQTVPLNLLDIDWENAQFSQLRAFNGYIYLVEKTTGVLVFNALGNYKNTILKKGIEFIDFKENSLILQSSDGWEVYDLLSFSYSSLFEEKVADALFFTPLKSNYIKIKDNNLTPWNNQ